MPRIDPYVQQQDTFVRSPVPGRQAQAEDYSGPGMRILGNTLQEESSQLFRVLEERKAREEVTDAQTRLNVFSADMSLQLDERSRTAPLDAHANFAQKFNDDLEGPLRKMGEKYQTRAGQEAFQRGAGELTGHFIKQAGLAQAHMAGLKAKQDWLTFESGSRNAVLDNPLDYDRQKKLMLQTLSDPNGLYVGHLKTEERMVMARTAVENLAESAVRGIIRAGAPELALKQLQGGTWNSDLNALDKERLEKAADIGIRAKEVEASRQRTAEEAERKALVRKIEADLILKLGGGTDGKDHLTTPDVIRSGLLEEEPERARSLINEIHTRSREQAQPIVTDPSVAINIEKGIRKGTITDEMALYKYREAGVLSFEDFGKYRNEVANMRTPEGRTLIETKGKFLDGVKHQITKANPLLGQLDPSGDQDFYEFSQAVEKRMNEYKKDKKNPYDLFDPGKPDYVGKPDGLISHYQKGMGESMNSISRNLARQTRATEPPTSSTPRLPGESIKDWQARRKH